MKDNLEISITEKLSSINRLIESKDSKNHYIATCILRKYKHLPIYKELITKIPISSRINSMRDVLFEVGITSLELPYKDPKSPFEKYMNACVIIPTIVKAYNEGWEPNWNNSNEYKYYPYFKRVGSAWSFDGSFGDYSFSGLPGCFYYKNRDILMEACKKFQDIYNDWLNFK